MNITKNEINRPYSMFRNEEGAIDLSSIMVGIIVIGLIGGIIAATVFSLIPWAQDNAAKQQLDSIVSAENAYMGLTSDASSSLPTGATTNTYGSSPLLASAGLLSVGKTYCASANGDGKSYTAFAQSASGKLWSLTSSNSKPVIHTGNVPTDCHFILPSDVDPSPKITSLTYLCDATVTGTVPFYGTLTGKETWSDGSPAIVYSAASMPTTKTLTAGVPYTMTFEGTYQNINGSFSTNVSNFSKCLTSVNHWGSETSVINASDAFKGAAKLTDVPRRIPSTITNLSGIFQSASSINDADISNWNTSNVTSLSGMFWNASKFNQPLNNWNTGKVADMSYMFSDATAFNQNIDSWDTSKLLYMQGMFRSADSFNQPLNSWNVANVTSLESLFWSADTFNQPLDKWNVANVTTLYRTFNDARTFNQNINSWNVSKVKTMEYTFYGASRFNQPLGTWNTGLVTNMNMMLSFTLDFNQPLNSWNVSNVTNMSSMFYYAKSFNQPLNNWNTINVKDMNSMFYANTVFVQDISTWTTTALINGTSFAPASTFPVNYKPTGTTLY